MCHPYLEHFSRHDEMICIASAGRCDVVHLPDAGGYVMRLEAQARINLNGLDSDIHLSYTICAGFANVEPLFSRQRRSS